MKDLSSQPMENSLLNFHSFTLKIYFILFNLVLRLPYSKGLFYKFLNVFIVIIIHMNVLGW